MRTYEIRADHDRTSIVVYQAYRPELRGATLDARSIQVGLSRHVIDRYADDWTLEIKDLTPLVRRIHRHVQDDDTAGAKALLPRERVYPLGAELGRRIGVDA